MSYPKEKGRPAEGSPNPKFVMADNADQTTNRLNLQVSRLTSRCAVSAAMAEALAPLAFGVVS
jgi:hypothetical protein